MIKDWPALIGSHSDNGIVGLYYVDRFIYWDVASGEIDVLTYQRWGKGDGSTIGSASDGSPQRARPIICCGGNMGRAGRVAIIAAIYTIASSIIIDDQRALATCYN